MEIKEVKDYFTKEINITRLRLIIFIVGIVIAIFMNTNAFDKLDEAIKIIIIASMFGMSILFKVDLFSKKEVGKQIVKIYKDKEMSWYEKGLQFGNIGMELLNEAGVLWGIGLEEQFPETKKNDPYIYRTDDGIDYTDTCPTDGTTKEE